MGNGSPWDAETRSPGGGDNLFLSSIVAVKAESGEYVWHYQTTPRESWDYTATQSLIVAELNINGVSRRVIMQAPKNGFFYVLDARTGELLRADAYARMNWSDGVDVRTGRPNVRKEARSAPFNVVPGPGGGHNWHPMAYSQASGLVYIPRFEYSFIPSDDPSQIYQSYLQAWDPIAGREVWHTEQSGRAWPSGVLTTSGGLVFTGSAREFQALDADNGEILWRADVRTGVLAGAITYELNGRQYIAISVGGYREDDYYAPTYSRFLVFALDGTATLPPSAPYTPLPLSPPPDSAGASVVTLGKTQYTRHCTVCHLESSLVGQLRSAPDLTRSPLLHSQASFDDVVLQGMRVENGMPAFTDLLAPQDTAAIRAYIIHRANELLQ